MNKEQAIEYMVDEVERIERDCQNSKLEPSKMKKEAVAQILNSLKEVQIDDEN